MAIHTQTIRRQFAYELFECVWSFCGIGASKVNIFSEAATRFFFKKNIKIHLRAATHFAET